MVVRVGGFWSDAPGQWMPTTICMRKMFSDRVSLYCFLLSPCTHIYVLTAEAADSAAWNAFCTKSGLFSHAIYQDI